MTGKGKRQQVKQLSTLLVLGATKAEQMKVRDKTILQKKNEY